LIRKEEIPEGCGLIYVYPDSMAMRKIIRPKFREIEHPVEILLHIIFWKEKSNPYPFFSSKAEYFNAWLKHRKLDSDLAYSLKGALREEINKVRRENDNLKADLKYQEKTVKEYEILKNKLNELGIHGYGIHQILTALDERLKVKVPNSVKRDLEAIQKSAGHVLSLLVG
jgi:hypothetical protein